MLGGDKPSIGVPFPVSVLVQLLEAPITLLGSCLVTLFTHTGRLFRATKSTLSHPLANDRILCHPSHCATLHKRFLLRTLERIHDRRALLASLPSLAPEPLQFLHQVVVSEDFPLPLKLLLLNSSALIVSPFQPLELFQTECPATPRSLDQYGGPLATS